MNLGLSPVGAGGNAAPFFVPETMGAALGSDSDNRLVKGTKSPTRLESPKLKPFAADCRGQGRFTVVGYREWSDEYRIRTEVHSIQKQPPPENVGDRVTKILTTRGARKIAESCEFMALQRGGYSTFATLTLDLEARARIEQKIAVGSPYRDGEYTEKPHEKFKRNKRYKSRAFMGAYTPIEDGPFCPVEYENKSSIQREVSRFFDGLQKMYVRGWEAKYKRGRVKYLDGAPFTPIEFGRFRFDPAPLKTAGYRTGEVKRAGRNGPKYTPIFWDREKLDYLWVAECPDTFDKETNEKTGENPHVHLMMRYRIPYAFFPAWARRLEGLWGQGMAHLEKIKDGAAAGAYMAKAAGYLCKAQGKEDQGEIRGNRYNISSSARAPDWVCVGRYELGRMGFLIAEAAEHFDEKFGHIRKRRDALKTRLENCAGVERHKIGKLLEKTRKTLRKMPRISQYQAILKGEQQFSEFMQWAKSDQAINDHKWLPEKSENEGFQEQQGKSQWLHEYMARRANRREWRFLSRLFSAGEGTEPDWVNHAARNEWLVKSLVEQVRAGEIEEFEPANDYLYEYQQYALGAGG